MVAPTRTPQARGVKCELCKKILANATWLDQNKLAQNVQDAETVLNLIKQHSKSDCPCIPRNIENLLTGSTHFEVHRLVLKRLDDSVYKKQYEYYHESRQRIARETSRNKSKVVNDCDEFNRTSRFDLCTSYYDKKSPEIAILSTKHLKHLIQAIVTWRKAMEDTASPFNSKLALRLGLTHHVIYACYLFKYYKLLDHQLATANLLLNLFKSIEGVTQNAILHAYYLLVRTLLDCNQIHLARQNLKQATKIANYVDKTHYESILLTCVSCELNLLIGDDSYDNLDLLAKLARIHADDKLQHYYARTYALSIIIKYIHKYPTRSDLCFEISHTFRYLSAIIRRCFESSFELILFTKETNKLSRKEANVEKNQILDYSWIKFALCDFVFSAFELCSNFYIKSGQPENLQLLYNGLNLVAYRSGSCYWQARMTLIGANLDSLCDKLADARAKLDAVCHIINYSSDSQLMNLLRLDLEVNRLSFDLFHLGRAEHGLALDLLMRIKSNQQSLIENLSKIELYDCDTSNTFKTQIVVEKESSMLVLDNGVFARISSKCLKVAIISLQNSNQALEARKLINTLGSQLDGSEIKTLSYYDTHDLLEILISFADVEKSQEILLEAIKTSDVFLQHGNSLAGLESQLSMLTIAESDTNQTPRARRKNRRIKPAICKLALNRGTKRKGTYNVASQSEENLSFTSNFRYFDTCEAVKNFETLTNEELIACYLRNSEPNPDYLIYRKANELLLSYRLRDQNLNLDQILYHFCESSTSNTMRYRWMMLEEQHLSPYEPHEAYDGSPHFCLKNLGFVNMLLNNERAVKSFVRSIPEDFRLVQFKYVLNKKCQNEHLLIAAVDNCDDPVFIQTTRTLESDDFFEDAKEHNEDSLSLPKKILTRIEEAKKTLSYTNQRLRTERREELEREIGLLLRDFEDDWLGPFRFILSGKRNDFNYNIFIRDMVEEIRLIMKGHPCSSIPALSLVIENAPILSREEFRQLIATLFGCPLGLNTVTECFNRWLKSIQPFLQSQSSKLDKTAYFQTLAKSQVGLILDKELEHVPFESLPMVRIEHQGIFRVPSLRLFSIIANQHCEPSLSIDASNTAYILDPANNLEKTRQRFSEKLKAQKIWTGAIGRAPSVDELEKWLSLKELFIFIGHGAGTTYYNRLRKSRGLSSMPIVRPLSIVMGCSSGRVMAEGPKLESFGINWVFILRGAPAYLGLLWDVTDTDIDKFLDSLLNRWIGSHWNVEVDNMVDTKGESGATQHLLALTDAVAQVRSVCKLKLLIGSTPVIYGLPVCCKS